MTVCIATICEAETSPKIVYCADRLQTSVFSFEHTPKVEYWGNAIVMSSGKTSVCKSIIETAEKAIRENYTRGQETYQIYNFAEYIKTASKNYFKKEAEERFLNSRGLKFEEFYTKLKDYPEWFAKDIDSDIKKLEEDFEVSFIVAGLDNEGAQIYEIERNGKSTHKNYLGFSIIGEGGYLSLPEITKDKYSINASLGEVVFRVFNAKSVSERVGSVGKETDLGVLFIRQKEGEKEKPFIEKWDAGSEFKAYLENVIGQLRKNETKYVESITKQLNETFYPQKKPVKKAESPKL